MELVHASEPSPRRRAGLQEALEKAAVWDYAWPVNEDPGLLDFEKPRFLLPEGCKDLIDAIRLQELNAALAAAMARQSPAPAQHGLPVCVTISEFVRVDELAAMLLLKPFDLIEALIEFHVFASTTCEISFDTAAKVCAHFGVAVHRAEDE